VERPLSLPRRRDLSPPHLNLVDTRGEDEALIHGVLAHAEVVTGVAELGALLADLGRMPARRRGTLDLIAHSSGAAGGLLQLGDTLIDADDPAITALFAAHATTIRAHASEVRLLGCSTAAQPRGRATLRALSAILELPVRGAVEPICDAYFDEHGFRAKYCDRLADGAWIPPW
jgi:hypothetical protein